MKDLKTTDLLDKFRDANDEEWDEIFDELNKRPPFDYLNEQIDELKNSVKAQEEEIQKLRNSLREHNHMPDGKAVKRL